MKNSRILCLVVFLIGLGLFFTQGSGQRSQSFSQSEFSSFDQKGTSSIYNVETSGITGFTEHSVVKPLERNYPQTFWDFLSSKSLMLQASGIQASGFSYLKFSRSISLGLPVFQIAFLDYQFT